MGAFTIGSVVGGVRLDAEIGRGGMGVVYRGFQAALNRDVAVKVVHGALADDEEFRARFRRECEIAASLEHPHVVPIYSADADDGRLSVTMRSSTASTSGERAPPRAARPRRTPPR